jgi:hypothetical protein
MHITNRQSNETVKKNKGENNLLLCSSDLMDLKTSSTLDRFECVNRGRESKKGTITKKKS